MLKKNLLKLPLDLEMLAESCSVEITNIEEAKSIQTELKEQEAIATARDKERLKEYYKTNKADIISKAQSYYMENAEKIKRQKQLYYQKNREKILAYQHGYYTCNLLEILAKKKLYAERNKERIA